MGGFIAKNVKKDKKVAAKEVMSRLERQRNNLIIYQQQTEPVLENDRQQAKQLLEEGKREEAKKVLRRRRYRQQQLQSSNAQLDKLDQIANAFEFAIALEISHSRQSAPKRSKWKSIIKRKFKKSQHNSDTRNKLGKPVDEDIEIVEVLDVSNKKESRKRNKVYSKVRNGIQKQKEIDEAMALSLKLETGDEEAVHEELEDILNSGYQPPDIDQDISNDGATPRGSILNDTAEIAAA